MLYNRNSFIQVQGNYAVNVSKTIVASMMRQFARLLIVVTLSRQFPFHNPVYRVNWCSENTMSIILVEKKISKSELAEIAQKRFGDLIKAVVDIEKGIMMIGGELHVDEEALLLEQGSKQQDLWGINLYPMLSNEDFVEFDSMINLKPSQGNRSRGVDDPVIRQKIIEIVDQLVQEELVKQT